MTIPSDAPLADVYAQIAKETSFSVHRLRLTKGSDGKLLPNDEATVLSTGLRSQSTIYVKDLGPQIGWRTVFFIEYLGPLLIHPFFLFTLRSLLYNDAPISKLQKTTCLLVVLHFIKRELETVFVHRFSLATMPARNIFKNSAHYWILSGFNMAYWLYRADSPTATTSPNGLIIHTGLLIYIIGELGNLNAHLVLRGLRSAGGRERGIPHGFGFGLVTCPNYMFEVLSWLGVYLASNFNWSVLLFIVVSTGQMMSWAKKKESKYRKEFGDRYKKKRSTMLPGIW